MNRFAFSLLCIGGAAALALSVFLFRMPLSDRSEPILAAAANESSYYASVVNNHVAIYLRGQNEPVLITEIDARTLPDADRKLLQDGLPLENAADVNHLLEDYGS